MKLSKEGRLKRIYNVLLHLYKIKKQAKQLWV